MSNLSLAASQELPTGVPEDETKIELVTEALESLTLAQVQAITATNPAAAFENVVAARSDLKDALKLLLKPTLRAVKN